MGVQHKEELSNVKMEACGGLISSPKNAIKCLNIHDLRISFESEEAKRTIWSCSYTERN